MSDFANLQWLCSGPLLTAHGNPHDVDVSIKDPSVVFFEGRWHVYATSYVLNRPAPHMVYTSFERWDEADAPPRFWIDFDAEEHCAPLVFYFRPQQKWYLIYQRRDLQTGVYGPAFSTMENVNRPETLTPPRDLFTEVPACLPDKKWLDFWVICDEAHAYLFFVNNRGQFFRSRTLLANFPFGWSEPEVVLSGTIHDLFEANCTYRLKNGQYFTIIEAVGKETPGRYYKAWLADKLDGEWAPLSSENQPFAALKNTIFAPDAMPWTTSISHGELLRDGYDERMLLDENNLALLFQGNDPHEKIALPAGMERGYRHIPYKIGLARVVN